MKRTVRYTISAGAYRLTFYDELGGAHTVGIATDTETRLTLTLYTLETTDITEIHDDATQDQAHGGLDEPGNGCGA